MSSRPNNFRALLTGTFFLLLLFAGLEVGLRCRHSLAVQDGIDTDTNQVLRIPDEQTFYRQASLTEFSTDDGVDVRLNSFGLRDEEIVIPRPPGTFRILCLGDEELIETRLPVESLWTSLIEPDRQDLPAQKSEVINAGIEGGCPLQSWLMYRHRLAGVQPNLIVVTMRASDVRDDRRMRRHCQLDRMEVPIACPHPSTVHQQKRVSGWQKLLVVQWALGESLDHLAESNGPDDDASAELLTTDVELAAAPLAMIKRTADAHYCRVLAVILPDAERLPTPLDAVVRSAGVDVLDLADESALTSATDLESVHRAIAVQIQRVIDTRYRQGRQSIPVQPGTNRPQESIAAPLRGDTQR